MKNCERRRTDKGGMVKKEVWIDDEWCKKTYEGMINIEQKHTDKL